jgi:hypothetical protein
MALASCYSFSSPVSFKIGIFTLSLTSLMLSSIRESNGMITKVTFRFSSKAGSWKVRDFPPPVGIRAITSFLHFVALMISL